MRFLTAHELQKFAGRLGVEPALVPAAPMQDVRPTDPVPVVLTDPESRRREVRLTRWGLIPQWSKDVKGGARMANARSETLSEKPAFRDAFCDHRCILPLDGFFEFDETTRYRISLADGETMGVAGLWAVRYEEGIEPLTTCTLITCVPNELISPVHDRMPAVLLPEDYERWLDPDLRDPQELTAMLAPFPADRMRMDFDGLKKTARQAAKKELSENQDSLF